MVTDILVPTDGSEPAKRAFDHALEMASVEHAHLHLLHIVDSERYGEPALSSAELVVTEQEDAATQQMARLSSQARQRGVEATHETARGDPIVEIQRVVDTDGIDTVVLGRQGFQHRRSMGSLAGKLLRRSDVDVVLV